MIRIFISVTFLLALAVGFVWLAEHPGLLQLTWQGKQVETTMMVAAIALLILIIVAALVWSIFRAIWRSPQMLKGYFAARRRDHGYNALSSGLVAVGEGDAKRATKAASDAGRYLNDAPLALLLRAQAAQLSGEFDTARTTFQEMLDAPETRLLGLRGLFMEAERTNEPAAALHLAMTAMDEAGRHPARAGNASSVASWAGPAVLRYQCAAEDWDGAIKTIASNTSAGLTERKEAKRKRAVILVAKAINLEDGEPQEAKIAALEAHKLAPDLVPAAVVAGRVLARLGELRRAIKTLEATWKLSPHPDLADAYGRVRPGDAPRDRVKRIRTLVRLTPDHLEGAIALAKAAIEAQDWEAARLALRPHLSTPTQRACLLMADIEEGEHGDKGRVREWLSKAVHALADPVWIADGVIYDHWAPVSLRSGALDVYEWKIPDNALARPSLTLSDNDVLLAPLDVREAKAEPEPEAPKPSKEETTPVTATAQIVENEEQPDSETTDDEAEPDFVDQNDLSRVPDDPGPAAETADTDKRFRLF
ncbi:MAG: heme biosynthesis protein HemY [Rhizobiales bacterium]|nr:heme biosynthesis protein HemY [Hyphomicrobiales bacterium]